VVAAVRKVATDVGADAVATLRSTPGALENVFVTLLNDVGELEGDVEEAASAGQVAIGTVSIEINRRTPSD